MTSLLEQITAVAVRLEKATQDSREIRRQCTREVDAEFWNGYVSAYGSAALALRKVIDDWTGANDDA